MADAKHTPGRWNVAQSASGKLLVESTTTGAEICKEIFSGDVSEANMRLIAAAPTTAEMAMDFTLLVEAYVRGERRLAPVTEGELADAMHALRAHIAAATGGNHG